MAKMEKSDNIKEGDTNLKKKKRKVNKKRLIINVA